ncbi:MAG: hypothetical protein IT492_12610 [Gammaproteobacteria bacterium]|nr:hypothetical protein [Gammaproteobacteria bacterium]
MKMKHPYSARRLLRGCAVSVLVGALGACSHVSMPKVSMPKMPSLSKEEEKPKDQSATPRDLMTAKLVNPRPDPNIPNLTVGKLMEFADRYLACDCANMRFGQSWQKVDDGYILLTNSDVVRPLHFVCKDVGESRECFLAEIDRGPQTPALTDRFVPGGDFIKFLYENGVKCERATPCQ